MKKWYVVHIKPNQELTAEQQLKNQNFEVFYPRCIQQVHNPNTDRITKRVSPLFPGYMFVSFDIAEPCGWQKIPNTRGVLNLIGMKESSVLSLPPGCVEDIMTRVDCNNILKGE
jgi:transcriptional antiterminator RfaH